MCFRVYSEEDFNDMDDDKLAEINRTNSETVLLKILGQGVVVEDFELIDKMDPANI